MRKSHISLVVIGCMIGVIGAIFIPAYFNEGKHKNEATTSAVNAKNDEALGKDEGSLRNHPDAEKIIENSESELIHILESLDEAPIIRLLEAQQKISVAEVFGADEKILDSLHNIFRKYADELLEDGPITDFEKGEIGSYLVEYFPGIDEYQKLESSLEEFGEWELLTAKDSLDDSRIVVATHSKIIVRCGSNRTTVTFKYDDYLGDDTRQNEKYVAYRFDDGESVTEVWPIASDFQTLIAKKPIVFAKSLSLSQRLVIEVTPYGERPQRDVFNTLGAKKAISDVAAACNWIIE